MQEDLPLLQEESTELAKLLSSIIKLQMNKTLHKIFGKPILKVYRIPFAAQTNSMKISPE
jgi:hypothetical protein